MDQDREQRIQKYREQSERADELQTGGDEEEASQLRAQGLEAARANGDEDYGLFFEAELACAAGNHSTAIALLHKSIELVSLTGGGDYFLLRNMGVYHAFNGEPGVAIEWYEKALEANPEDYRAMCGTGHAVSMSGDLDVAIEWFNSALKIAPDYDRCFQGLSMCALLQGKLEEAVDNVTLAARSAPRAQRANFYFVLGAAGLLPEVAWRDLAIAEVEAPLTKKVELSELSGFIYQIRRAYAGQTKEFLKKKAEAEEAKRKFLLPNSDLDPERSVMLLLRRWNSYTPAVPGTKTPDSLGGGYFIWHKGHGIVIDPGYDFLENFAAAGGRVCDVHTVILTHAHPDHTADLERLCTLLHEYHENGEASQSPEPTRRVRFLLSNGALVKFSGMLPLRGVNYIDRVDTLTPGCSFDLADNVRLQIIHAWHDDVLARDQSVGLWFEFGGPGSSRRLLFTSDTGLFPLKRDGDKSPDQSGPEVWAGYPHEAEQLVRPDLMITHIGSIQEAELEIGGDLTPEDACYANHLGIIGTARLITKCRPRLAVVSEFGEEMRDFRTTLIEGLQEKVIDHVFTGQPDNERPRVVLGDLPFIYDMVTGTVYDCVDQDWLAPGEIAFIQADDDELKVGKGLVYYHRRAVTPDKDDLNRRVEEHWHHIKWRRGLYFKEKD